MTKILLVEDDKSLREIYGVRLLAEGFDIVSAGDGEEALAMAIKEKPTLIISDVMMPKISGFDMLDILRSTTETRDIKVIMMTALSSEDQRARGEQLGADRYLVKSQVGIEDVVRTVHEVLGDTPGASTPAAPVAAAAPTEPAAPAATEPTAPTDTAAPAADSVADAATPTLASPGNDAAGPLPPQPSEITAPAPVIEPVVVASDTAADTASTLPQPTAPFSSPRPTNLGEQVVHPEGEIAAPAADPVVPTDTPAAEPSAAAPGGLVIEPLPSSADLTITPAVEPVATPAADPALATPTDPAAPASDSTTPPVV
jgi:CheY-like chemotaxis protein